MKTLLTSLLFAATLAATPITFVDPWGQGAPDVIGSTAMYDVQKIVVDVTSTGVIADIYTNFGTGGGIAPYFAYDRWYNIGDLFFTVGGALKYGVPLHDHAGSPNGGPSGDPVTAGSIYLVGGTLTARQALNEHPGYIYRPDEVVLLLSDGTLDALAAGTVTLDVGGEAAHRITVDLPGTASQFYADLSGADWGVHFASATCGNDVLDWHHTPEPSTMMLIGGALMALGLAIGLRRVS